MHIAMLCDASPEIGGGHLMRCVALAEEARRRGHSVALVGDLGGHPLIDVAAGVAEVAHVSRGSGLTTSILDRTRPDLVHVDSYDDIRLSPGCVTSAMRDGEFGTSTTQIVIDPTPGGTVPDDAPSMWLAGSKFAPLRLDIIERRRSWRPVNERRVLVTMGSTDPAGLTPQVVELLLHNLHLPSITVLGDSSRLDATMREQVRHVQHTRDFASLALGFDIVVTASGTTTLELACLGVPMALVCAAQNQRPAYEHLTSHDAGIGLGSRTGWSNAGLDHLRQCLNTPSSLLRRAETASRLVDGMGSTRILDVWERLITCRAS